MSIEKIQSIEKFSHLSKSERSDIYKDFANRIFPHLEEENGNGSAMVELIDFPKGTVNTICRGIKYHLYNDHGLDYEFHFKILSDPNDQMHHRLIFSKKPWGQVEWQSIAPAKQ